MKNIITYTIYSIITFCVLSFLSVMVSLLQSVGDLNAKPISNIGFPYHYYFQFWLSGSDSPNCGWNIKNFAMDAFFTWVIVVLVFLLYNRRKKRNNQNEK